MSDAPALENWALSVGCWALKETSRIGAELTPHVGANTQVVVASVLGRILSNASSHGAAEDGGYYNSVPDSAKLHNAEQARTLPSRGCGTTANA